MEEWLYYNFAAYSIVYWNWSLFNKQGNRY